MPASAAPASTGPAVLLAEHEPEVAELGRRYLTRAGADVIVTTGAAETIAALTARTATVAVLDLTMPGLDPRHLRRLLAANAATRPPQPNQAQKPHQAQEPRQAQEPHQDRLPALFLLSAGMHPRDLRVAAESCLWRPFSPRLLVSRVLAIAPRPGPATGATGATGGASPPGQGGLAVRTIGGLTLDPATRRGRPATGDTGGIAFTPAEFALLTALADHPGRVLTRDRLQAILAQSAHGRPVAGRAIDVHVSQVRAKLPDPALIRTVRGVGYVLDERDPGAAPARDG